MPPGTRGSWDQWYEFTSYALKVTKILARLKFIEEYKKSIVVDGLNRGDELEHLDDDMCKSLSKTAARTVLTRKRWSYTKWIQFY